jgi:hypothetical protein
MNQSSRYWLIVHMLIRQFVRLPATLGPPFRNYRLPDVNAFALTNLLVPSQHAVSLKEAKLPGDLYLTGSLVQAIAVTPVDTTLTPGNTVQFTAASRGFVHRARDSDASGRGGGIGDQ